MSSAMPSTPSSFSLSALGSPTVGTPESRPAHKNYHPYLIQSTSSSLLTRSNSSPSQPIADVRHKSSRSMSSLAASASEGELDKVESGDKKEVRRRSMEGRPGMKRSGTLPAFPRVDETPTKTLDVPANPKHWSPSDLAKYLGHTLRTAENLPAPLVKDIESWVLRHRVDGRAFLKGNQESWAASSRPPPFLPLLLTTSRRLRRHSLQARLGNGSPLRPGDSPETGSMLLEEDEDDLSGVRRMANAIESPCIPELKPQWTGGSSTSEVWRRWDGGGRLRRESDNSSVAESPVPLLRELSDEEHGTIKAPVGLGISKHSPPPPYRSPNPDEPELAVPEDTPERSRLSVTPTPDRPGVDAEPSPEENRRELYAVLRQPSGEAGSTARRVTIRPNRVESIFAPVKSPREVELEDQLELLASRVKELESRLVPQDKTQPGSILSSLGFAPGQDLPTRMRQLPAYLFLVGVGVGAVVVRVFMRRR